MPDLDLTKAIEAGARVLTGQVLVSEYDDLNSQTRLAFSLDTANILTAALPHILDALAEDFKRRMDDAEQCSVELDDLEAAWRLVRAKAYEVRQ